MATCEGLFWGSGGGEDVSAAVVVGPVGDLAAGLAMVLAAVVLLISCRAA